MTSPIEAILACRNGHEWILEVAKVDQNGVPISLRPRLEFWQRHTAGTDTTVRLATLVELEEKSAPAQFAVEDGGG